MNKQGQIISYDILIASFIFLLIIGSIFMTLNNQSNTKNDNLDIQKLQLDSMNYTERIFNDTNCLEFGLVTSKRELNQEKINCVNSLDYNTLKKNISANNYEFYFKLTQNNNTLLEKGIKTEKSAISFQRFGMLNGEIVKGVFVLYEK